MNITTQYACPVAKDQIAGLTAEFQANLDLVLAQYENADVNDATLPDTVSNDLCAVYNFYAERQLMPREQGIFSVECYVGDGSLVVDISLNIGTDGTDVVM